MKNSRPVATTPKSTVEGMIRSNDEFVSGLLLVFPAGPLVKRMGQRSQDVPQDVPGLEDPRTMGPWCFPYAKSACWQVFMWAVDVDMLGFEEFVDQCRQKSFPGDSGTAGKTTLGG